MGKDKLEHLSHAQSKALHSQMICVLLLTRNVRASFTKAQHKPHWFEMSARFSLQ